MLIVLGLAVGLVFWWKTATGPVDSHDKTQKVVVIAKGTGTHEIARTLKADGLIKSEIAFVIMVRKLGLEGKIQAGDFKLSPSYNLETTVENLTHGSLDIWVTIPEGYRADQIADTLQKAIPGYETSWRESLRAHEGYLFPDTYLIPRNAGISDIVALFTDNFAKRYEAIQKGAHVSRSENDIVILASMVEREARLPQDRPLVASVMLNRLSIGMPLQIDATVQYAIGTRGDWWPKLTSNAKSIASTSPYNTYTNVGLPPTPISNPGTDSLKAVIDAPETNYLYYFTDRAGQTHFAKTLREQNVNIKRYGL